jgi:hypothetical protein
MVMARIQVVIDEVEREEFRARAQREGMSLSEWLRQAGRDRLAESAEPTLATVDALREFFDEIDRANSGLPAEDDWEVHEARIAASKREGLGLLGLDS